jgi:hypothetical protein
MHTRISPRRGTVTGDAAEMDRRRYEARFRLALRAIVASAIVSAVWLP